MSLLCEGPDDRKETTKTNVPLHACRRSTIPSRFNLLRQPAQRALIVTWPERWRKNFFCFFVAGITLNSPLLPFTVTTANAPRLKRSSFGSSHRELPQIFALVRVVPRRLAPPAQLVVEPHQQVPDGLGAGDDVEGRGQRPALVEVAHPQLGACKLPLDVGVVLQREKQVVGFQRFGKKNGSVR